MASKLSDFANNFASSLRKIIENIFPKLKKSDNGSATAVNNAGAQPVTYQEFNAPKEPTQPLSQPTGTGEPQSATYSENVSGSSAPASGTEGVYSRYAAAPASEEKAADNVMSYEDYIAEMKKGYQEQLDAANKQAEQTKARAMADAETAYSQNKATYGSNGEIMAQMGLSGGGYSDYLNAQAYAQKRADVQVAKAQEIVSKDNARATYQQYIQAANEKLAEKALYDERLADQRAYEKEQTADQRAYEQQLLAEQRAYEQQQLEEQRAYSEQQAEKTKKQNVFDSLWAGVQSTDTTYTDEAIDSIAREYGLSDEQINSLKSLLKGTKDKAEKDKSKAILESALANVDASGTGSLDEYLNGLQDLGLSDEDRATVEKTIREQMGNGVVDSVNNSISQGDINSLDYNIATAEDYYKKGYISQEQLQTVYNKYATVEVETIANTDFGSDNQKKVKSYLSAQKDIDQWYKDGKLSEAMYKALKDKASGENYNAVSGGWYVEGLGTGRVNDDVDITIGATSRGGNGKTEYDLLCGSAVTDSEVISELNRIATGSASRTPDNSGEGAIFGTHNMSSNDKPNKLIVAYGNMYLYTTKGWTVLKSDNNDAEIANAIAAYVGSGTKVKAQYSVVGSSSSSSSGYTQPVVNGFKLPYRATTDETNKAYEAIKNNDYETFKKYMPSSYSEESKRAYYEKYGGVVSTSTSAQSNSSSSQDAEIAKKAANGTLTYNDVAKYNAGIRTQSEFARGNNSDKQTYGTYQAYLKAMYEKYKK